MTLKAELDRLFGSTVERGGVPGIVAMVADRDQLLYEGAFGVRDLTTQEPMTLDTVVWLASFGKAVVSAALLQLVETGRADLDASASEYLPVLAETLVLEGFDDQGEPVLRPPASPVTLRQLLTHTAGYGYEFWDAEVAQYQARTGIPSIFTCERDALRMPLLADPGTRWRYGINTDIAGQIIEAISGQRLGTYLRDHVFEPLGMRDSTFLLSEDQRARRAALHRRRPDGSLEPTTFVMNQAPEMESGGGALYSTAGDFLRFMRMILNEGELEGARVLAPATVKEMSTNQLGPLTTMPLTTVMPHLSNDVEFFPGVRKGFTFGFQINLDPAPTGRGSGGLGWAGLCNSFYWMDPTTEICGVYVSQILPFIDPQSLAAYEGFEAAVYRHRNAHGRETVHEECRRRHKTAPTI